MTFPLKKKNRHFFSKQSDSSSQKHAEICLLLRHLTKQEFWGGSSKMAHSCLTKHQVFFAILRDEAGHSRTVCGGGTSPSSQHPPYLPGIYLCTVVQRPNTPYTRGCVLVFQMLQLLKPDDANQWHHESLHQRQLPPVEFPRRLLYLENYRFKFVPRCELRGQNTKPRQTAVTL